MKMLARAAIGLFGLLACASPALAGHATYSQAPANYAPEQMCTTWSGGAFDVGSIVPCPSGTPASPFTASDPNNAAIFYNLTPSHVVSGTAYPYASYPVRILESTCTVATPVTVTLQGDGTGTGGTVTETLPAQSVPFQQILAAWKVTEVTAGALASNCVVDLVK